MGSDGYSWVETRPSGWDGQVRDFPGAWHVDTGVRGGGAFVAVGPSWLCRTVVAAGSLMSYT
jgi:hypothetical protein